MTKCFFCPNTETKYCGLCKQWLCDECRANYPQRVEAWKEEVKRKAIKFLKEKLGI